MLRNTLLIFLISLTGLQFAQGGEEYLEGKVIQGPFRTTVVDDGELSVLETGDTDFPVSLVLDVKRVDGVRVRSLVDKYDVAGSEPKIESLFFYPIRGKKNVIVLVSWELTSRGVGTYGTLYQVYAYERGSTNKLVANKFIRCGDQLSGIDGYHEGEQVSFLYKNSASIKECIKKGNN
jgi:hypothetical protein